MQTEGAEVRGVLERIQKSTTVILRISELKIYVFDYEPQMFCAINCSFRLRAKCATLLQNSFSKNNSYANQFSLTHVPGYWRRTERQDNTRFKFWIFPRRISCGRRQKLTRPI